MLKIILQTVLQIVCYWEWEKLYVEDLIEINSIHIVNLHKCSGPLSLQQKEQNNKINHLYYLNNYTINIHLNYFK